MKQALLLLIGDQHLVSTRKKKKVSEYYWEKTFYIVDYELKNLKSTKIYLDENWFTKRTNRGGNEKKTLDLSITSTMVFDWGLSLVTAASGTWFLPAGFFLKSKGNTIQIHWLTRN